MKYSLLLMMAIVTGAHSCEKKRNFDPFKDYYKRTLYNALIQFRNACATNKECGDYIKKTGSYIMNQIANHLAEKKDYTTDTFTNDHRQFLEFITEVIRKIKPEYYKSLQQSFDDVNEAFNDMKERKTKDKKRRIARKKAWEYSDSPSFSLAIETDECKDEED